MTIMQDFRATDRLLVLAPHPDDETLATGELIQLAAGAGAAVRVVFATDGDNNPWPQRWAERRWRIGSEERARWGARRRAEALAALATLGVEAGSARFLGWPDQGLTELLMRDDSAIGVLAAEITAFTPTHVAMPSLRDRHPDHGALRVMLDFALARARSRALGLGYVVHGREVRESDWRLADAARGERKREALMAHATQIGLSQRRLLRWAAQPEAFAPADAETQAVPAAGTSLRLPLPSTYRRWRRHDLLLAFGDARRTERLRLRLPPGPLSTGGRVLAKGACGGRVGVLLAGDEVVITFAPGESIARGYVKLERTWPRLVIFDTDTWQRLDELAISPDGAPALAEQRIPQRASI